MRLIDGRGIAAALAAELTTTEGRQPTLAIVVPAEDEASAWYVRSIVRTAAKVGITVKVDQLPADVPARLAELSADPGVHGIVCQTPIPPGAAELIDPAKDVDGANPASLGRLAAGLPAYPPATAAAVLEILRREEVPLAGRRAVVVGRSTVVGKPVALLLLAEHATVTICHSRTPDLAEVCAEADILVAAAGRAGLITQVRPGATVIDVGTNPTPDGRLVGDVDAGAVAERAAALTPVPGGVGPVTTMMLLRHTVLASHTIGP